MTDDRKLILLQALVFCLK